MDISNTNFSQAEITTYYRDHAYNETAELMPESKLSTVAAIAAALTSLDAALEHTTKPSSAAEQFTVTVSEDGSVSAPEGTPPEIVEEVRKTRGRRAKVAPEPEEEVEAQLGTPNFVEFCKRIVARQGGQ